MTNIADQLKIAGWPMRFSYNFQHGVLAHLPSLGELITACSPNFKSLELSKNGIWIVYAVDELNIPPFYGVIAEEVVASLWLYLKNNAKEKIHTTP